MRFWWKAAAGLLLALGQASGAQAAWVQAQTRHFTVYSEGNDAKLRGFAERLEKFDYLLRTVTGVTDPERGSPVKVYLLDNVGQVRALARNPNIGGFYATSDRSAFAVLSRGGKTSQFDFGAEEILFHEYTHHFMLHHFPAAYPAWYVEGFAEFFSVVKFADDGSIIYGNFVMGRAPGLMLGAPYPVKNLFARNTDGLSLRDGDRYYGRAWLLTHYFQYNAQRRAEFRRYLNDMANGVPDMRAESYFAGGFAALDKALDESLRKRKMAASKLTPGEMKIDAITLAPVDAAQGDLIDDELKIMYEPRKGDLPSLVRSIRATAAKYPQSAYALALLAEAEWKAEQKDAALADADRSIALDPKSARAYAVRAQVLLERAHESDKAEDWKAALTAIVRANKADTEDPVPLALFYRYHAMRGGKMPDIGYEGLYKAYTLLPQNPDYRFNFAEAMAARGNYAWASTLLDPIAYSPHGSEMREAALRMKADFDAQAAKKKPAGTPPPGS